MIRLPVVLISLCLALGAQAQWPVPTNAPKAAPAKIPNSWLSKAKGYEKALEIQKETGADIFIYFSRQAPANEKGLCQWFESKGLNAQKVKEYLRNYIKVEVPLPSNPDSQKLAEQFDVRKCPAVFIVQPGGFTSYCKVFDWPDGKPKLWEPEQLIQFFMARSSERYQVGQSPGEP